MTGALIVLLLGSALLHAVWNAIIKGGSNTLFETVMKTGSGGFLGLCGLVFLPLPAPESWPFLLGSVGIHFFYYLLLAHSYKNADMSYVYTIMRGTAPFFTALVAVFVLGDRLNPAGWAGVLLLSAGILSLTLDSLHKRIFKVAPTTMALCNAAVIMGYTVVDGQGVRLSGSPVGYVCWIFFLNAFPILIYSLVRYKGGYFRYVAQRWKYGTVGGLCSGLAYGLSVWAMARAPISLVAALRETSVIFGLFLAVFFLKERLSYVRVFAIFLVTAGAIAIKIS